VTQACHCALSVPGGKGNPARSWLAAFWEGLNVVLQGVQQCCQLVCWSLLLGVYRGLVTAWWSNCTRSCCDVVFARYCARLCIISCIVADCISAFRKTQGGGPAGWWWPGACDRHGELGNEAMRQRLSSLCF
jgi:hypothetical protein